MTPEQPKRKSPPRFPRQMAVTRLHREIRDAVDAAIREERATLDEIVAMIAGMGEKISRSAVWRYRAQMLEEQKRYREAREVARVWMDAIDGSEDDGKLARMAGQSLMMRAMHSIAEAGARSDKEGTTVPSAELLALANAMKAGMQITRTQYDLTMRIEAYRKAKAEAAAAVESVATERGLSTEMIQSFRAAILGVSVIE